MRRGLLRGVQRRNKGIKRRSVGAGQKPFRGGENKKKGDVSVSKLPVISILRDTLRAVYNQRLPLFRTLAAPAAILAAVDTYLLSCLVEDPGTAGILLSLVFYLVGFTIFAVTAHRVILLGETAVPKYGLYRWTWRETRFLGRSALVFGLVIVIAVAIAVTGVILFAAFGFQFGGDTPEVEFEFDSIWTLAFLLLILPGGYLVSRWAPLFPATAVDERRDFGWAWRTTVGNGWRMVVIFVLLPVAFAFLQGFDVVQYSVVLGYLANLVGYVLFAVEVIAVSLSYRFFMRTAAENAE